MTSSEFDSCAEKRAWSTTGVESSQSAGLPPAMPPYAERERMRAGRPTSPEPMLHSGAKFCDDDDPAHVALRCAVEDFIHRVGSIKKLPDPAASLQNRGGGDHAGYGDAGRFPE